MECSSYQLRESSLRLQVAGVETFGGFGERSQLFAIIIYQPFALENISVNRGLADGLSSMEKSLIQETRRNLVSPNSDLRIYFSRRVRVGGKGRGGAHANSARYIQKRGSEIREYSARKNIAGTSNL